MNETIEIILSVEFWIFTFYWSVVALWYSNLILSSNKLNFLFRILIHLIILITLIYHDELWLVKLGEFPLLFNLIVIVINIARIHIERLLNILPIILILIFNYKNIRLHSRKRHIWRSMGWVTIKPWIHHSVGIVTCYWKIVRIHKNIHIVVKSHWWMVDLG